MTRMNPRALGILRRTGASATRIDDARRLAPPDPQAVPGAAIDPELGALRAQLLRFRAALWLRRFVRRAWIALAVVAILEVLLWAAARIAPLEFAAVIAAAIPAVVLVGLLAATVRVRPSLGETALAVDREAALGDRVASALALGALLPDDVDARRSAPFIARQRHDAALAIATISPRLFRPRLSPRPALAIALAGSMLVPLALVPNGMDAVLARDRQVRDTARAQAERLDTLADDLEHRGATSEDPRTRLSQELRDLVKQLRDHPADLDVNLARLGAVEASVRSQLDPALEQRASALASLSRSLSRAATGQPAANRD
ncbi:MAG TPA: hypothetical protein VIV06_12005, partial [Candidatus Limnocylindrales bacterium]